MVQLSQFHLFLLILVCSLSITGARAETENCTYQMDLTFVVDSSGSICGDTGVTECDNSRALVTFIHDIVKDMIIGENDVRVALILFESSAYIKWNLMAYHDKSELLKAIDKLEYKGGNTNTIAALGNLSTIYKVENGDRPGTRNTAILITDGKPRIGSEPYPMDDIRTAVKKVVDQDIRLLAVGVTNDIDQDTLKELSSPPHKDGETVFFAKDFQHFWKALKQLEIQNCVASAQRWIRKCTDNMDLAFVVDSSGSICDNKNVKTCENWEALKSFVRTIVDDMIHGAKDFRVALIDYSTDARIQWNLTTYHDKPALLEAIKQLPYHGHNTNTIDALGLLSTVFTAEYGDRPGARNTAILITDGKPMKDGNPTPMDEIRNAVKKVIDQGTRLLAVGVTNDIDMDTLKELSSPPHKENETVFVAKDYLNLEKVLGQLENQTCIDILDQSPNPGPKQHKRNFLHGFKQR